VTETVRYTYRLRPGRTAQAALLAEWGRCRWLWNEAVHQQKTRRNTMTCSECGTRAKERLGLGIRTFECAACGYTADRDVNAARTILVTAERVRASADDVRHSIASFRDGGSDAVRAGNPPDLPAGKR